MDWLALTRAAGYVGALGYIGALPAARLLGASGAALPATATVGAAPPDATMPGTEMSVRRAAGVSALLLLIAAVGRLVGQASASLDPGDPLTLTILRDIALGTNWGTRWCWQLATAAAAALAVAVDGKSGRRLLSATAAGAVALTLPLTGHAQEFPFGPMAGVTVQALHVTAAGLWLGTLGVAALAVASTFRRWPVHERVRALHALAVRFSPLALTGAGLAALAGVILAAANLRSVDALLSTTYGQLVLAKVALLLAVMALGGWNWRRAVPALEQPGASATALRHLARSAAAEIALSLAVLGATAVLSATDAPGLGHAETASAPRMTERPAPR